MPGVPKIYTSLKTFTDSTFFLCDEMPLIGRGIAMLVCNLIDPSINEKFKPTAELSRRGITFNDTDYSFTFAISSSNSRTNAQNKVFENILKLIKSSRNNIPPAFEGSWELMD